MNELYHHGIKGQKWGVRRYQNKDGSLTAAGEKRYSDEKTKWGMKRERLQVKTKSGDTIKLQEHPYGKLASFLSKYVKSVADNIDRTAMFDIKDNKNEKVGDITLYRQNKDSINVVWVTTKKSVRGKGYGTAVMKAAVDIAKDVGAKKVTLEVPGSSPDARHIYEKLGFKEKPSPDSDPDDIWGGLTNMELDLSKVNHSEIYHGGLFLLENLVMETYMKYLAEEIDNMGKEDELYHHGIKGQKWGVRRYQNKDGTYTSAGKKRRRAGSRDQEIKEERKQAVKNRRTLSSEDIQKRISRLKLEKEFKNLTEENISPGKKAAKDILKNAGIKMATAAAAGTTAYLVKAAMTKHFDVKEAANYIVPNPNKKK